VAAEETLRLVAKLKATVDLSPSTGREDNESAVTPEDHAKENLRL
jgi:hypothetical protein